MEIARVLAHRRDRQVWPSRGTSQERDPARSSTCLGEVSMKPLPVAIVAAVILALLWWFWPRDKSHEQASADASKAMVASTPAPGSSNADGSASAAGSTSAGSAAGAASTSGAAGSASTAGAASTASGTSAQAAAPAPKVEAPLVATVYFDFDRSGLRPGETPTLDAFVVKLKDRSYSS